VVARFLTKTLTVAHSKSKSHAAESKSTDGKKTMQQSQDLQSIGAQFDSKLETHEATNTPTMADQGTGENKVEDTVTKGETDPLKRYLSNLEEPWSSQNTRESRSGDDK
jgi:hypothetical protein